METEYFDLAIEGTALKDLFISDPNCKTVVVDASSIYGTTYPTISELEKSIYVSNIKITKDIRKEKEKVLIEACPLVIGANDKIIEKFGENAFGTSLDFIDITDIYFISDVKTRMPTSKNDIAALRLSNSDLFHFYKAIKEKDIQIIQKKFENIVHPLYKSLSMLSKHDFETICDNFGRNAFIYPLYGLSEISECASFKNSFRGVTYVLNTDLTYINEENDEYKHVFKCDIGTIIAKDYIPRTLDRNRFNVRVILTPMQKFNGNFLAFIERPSEFNVKLYENGRNASNKDCDNISNQDRENILIENCDSISNEGHINVAKDFNATKVIGISSNAKVCPDGMQLLYFIRKNGEINDFDLQKLMISENDITLDVSFISEYDIMPKY